MARLLQNRSRDSYLDHLPGVPYTPQHMSKMPNYSYVIFASGNAEWYREAAAPLAKSLEELVPFHGPEVPAPLHTVGGVVKNELHSIVLLGCTLFVAQRFATHFVDDIYAQIQPRIKAILATIDQKLTGHNRKAKKSFTVSVWYFDYNVLLSVTVVGPDFEAVAKQLDLVPVVQANALAWIAANGVGKLIHHYRVEDGKVNAAPVLLDSFEEMVKSPGAIQ